MDYDNREMKIDQIISYFNQHKINLIPPFQRGTVWNLETRQKLLVNMIQKRPIPAIFLYKQAEGPQFEYNILDGKQRLESLILFVGDRRKDLRIQNVEHYFFRKPSLKNVNFKVELDGESTRFEDLDDELVRKFREYTIPTIEIDMDNENTSIDEIINLFIDINQQGVKVSRFDVVKALGKDPLFKQVFDLIAVTEIRKKKSTHYKAKACNFVYVLKRLNLVSRLIDKNSRTDRMWERLTEIALFSRTKKHRAPAEILKAFINAGDKTNARMTKAEQTNLRVAFDYLAAAYRQVPELVSSRFATDQPQFYTLITSLLSTDTMTRFTPADLGQRLAEARRIIDGNAPIPEGLRDAVTDYRELSAKQTTHPNRREKRQNSLIQIIEAMGQRDD